MQTLILVIHILTAFTIIGLVLIQHGKGADAGAAFGSGSSQTMFGSQGATPFLLKITVAFATVFFITSLSLSYLTAKSLQKSTVRKSVAPLTIPQTKTPARPMKIESHSSSSQGRSTAAPRTKAVKKTGTAVTPSVDRGVSQRKEQSHPRNHSEPRTTGTR